MRRTGEATSVHRRATSGHALADATERSGEVAVLVLVLVLARGPGQSVVLDDGITVTVHRTGWAYDAVSSSCGPPRRAAAGPTPSEARRTLPSTAARRGSERPASVDPWSVCDATTEIAQFGHDHDGIGDPVSIARGKPR
jgi:hypothetical protein